MMPSFLSGFLMGRIFAGTGNRFGLHAGKNICNPLLASVIFDILLLIGLGALPAKAGRGTRAGLRFQGLCRI